tara:strand:+ start:218 stop:421 length:204 start_codon:yes stop_codon:yes gene_type:complete
MKTEIRNIKTEDLTKLKRDIELIKNILSEDYELSDWAKKELEEARKVPDSELISMNEIEKEFLKDEL